jgi:phage shock protein PspC (stress-responsive transcriptional regulator)
MQKVISINLNGHAYQLEESGYDALRAYLTRAGQELEGNPDRAEIMADLEQAIADKCQRYLGPHKTVVTSGEVDRIVAEMGPVNGAAGEDDAHAGPDTRETKKDASPKRLYRIPEGAMIAGVCTGLGAHFQVDVTIVRIGFVVAALVTQGFGIVAYIVLMFVIPEANTPETKAAAAGAPVNAKDIIDRAKRQYAEGRKQWRRQWREQKRQWQRQAWPAGAPPLVYQPPAWAAVLLPVFALAHVGLFLLMAATMISLVNDETVLDWELPPGVPVWAGVLMLLVAYQIAVAPLRAVHRWAVLPRPAAQPAWFAFWNAVAWLIGAAFVVWVASNHLPEIRDFMRNVPDIVRDFAYAVRDVFDRTREPR